MYVMYILKLADGSYYVGSTSNMENRLLQHNMRRVRSTKTKMPCEIIYQELHPDRSSAQSREYQIKKWKSRKAIERLVKK